MDMNWILKNIFESIANFTDAIFEYITIIVNNIFLNAVSNNDLNKMIDGVEKITAIASFSLVGVVIMKRIVATYITETEGDPDSDPLDLIMQAAISIAIISNNKAIFSVLLNAATKTGEEILTSLSSISVNNAFHHLQNFVQGKISSTWDGVMVVFVFIFIIGTIILCIKGGIRGAELGLMKILFPFFCCDLLTTRKERFNAFITSYLVTMFGYVLQILCFRFSGFFAAQFAGGASIEQILFGFAFLYLAIKAPKWLDKFVYSTGIGQSIGGGARSAAFMAPSLMRAFGK